MKLGDRITTDIRKGHATIRYTLEIDKVITNPNRARMEVTIVDVQVFEDNPALYAEWRLER